MNPSENTPQVFQDDEIDLVELLRPFFKNWRLLVKSAITFGFIGVVYSLSLPNIFTAKTTFIPQTGSESRGGSSLSGLASLAGINLGGVSSGSDIPASLYPQIVSSVPYLRELSKKEIIFEGESISLTEYFSISVKSDPSFFSVLKKYTIGLPSLVLDIFRDNSNDLSSELSNQLNYVDYINENEQSLFGIILGGLKITNNSKEGVLTLEFSHADNIIAAQVVERAKELLQARIIEFKNQSARELLTFTARQYEENNIAYERLQDSLAIFKDQNLNISSSLYQNRLDRLERELNIASSVAEQLASQVEQAKLQVNKDTPVFTIIEPVTVPYERASPKRSLIVIGLTFLGFFLSAVFIVVRKPITDLWSSLKSEKEE